VRLAVFTNQFPGRLNTFFARDMRALIDAGIQLEIFAFYPLNPDFWGAVPDLLGPAVLPRNRVHHFAPSAVAQAGVPWPPSRALPFLAHASPIVAASVRYGPGLAAKASYVSAYAWACIRRFGRERFDHVLAYWGNHAASAAYLFHRHTQATVPFSMFVHARMDLYHQPAFLATKLRYADNIFLVCEYNRGYLRDHFPAAYRDVADRISVHHLGLPLDETPFRPDGRPDDRLLGVGNLEPLKGFDRLIRAVGQLRARGYQLRLDLVGGGPQEQELRALAAELGLGDAVTFHGWLSSDRVMELMREVTMLVHPSIRPDAMPTVVKEAMAAGTPVVASDLAGIPEMLDGGRCGLLVPPGDVDGLVTAIATLLADPDRRRRLGMDGRRRVEAMFDSRRNGAELAERLRRSRRHEGKLAHVR
jgi:glycosyltransferase involved in cell wall biosynthesis